MSDPLGHDKRSAMSMAAMLLSDAVLRQRATGRHWRLTALYHDGTVQLTRDNGFESVRLSAEIVAAGWERAK